MLLSDWSVVLAVYCLAYFDVCCLLRVPPWLVMFLLEDKTWWEVRMNGIWRWYGWIWSNHARTSPAVYEDVLPIRWGKEMQKLTRQKVDKECRSQALSERTPMWQVMVFQRFQRSDDCWTASWCTRPVTKPWVWACSLYPLLRLLTMRSLA